MSNYNSMNTKILATYEQSDGNTRMLLFHECENGRHEYVVGSYFTTTIRMIDSEGHTKADYEWDWGHYFSSVVDAVDYWQREVAADLLDGFVVHSRVRNAWDRVFDYDVTVGYMDEELREELHMELAPCTNQEFFDAYALAHQEKFGELWEFDKPNPVI